MTKISKNYKLSILGEHADDMNLDFASILEALTFYSKTAPSSIAFVEYATERTITYHELFGQVQKLANVLLKKKLNSEAICLVAEPGIDAAIMYLGARAAGSTPAMLPAPETPADVIALSPLIKNLRKRIKPSVTLITGKVQRLLDARKENPWVNDNGLLIFRPSDEPLEVPSKSIKEADTGHWVFTSGTTGPGKAVRLSARAVAFNASYTALNWGFNEKSRILALGAPYHSAGLMVGYLMPILKGASSVIVSNDSFRREPKVVLSAISTYGITHIAASDKIVNELVKLPKEEWLELDLQSWVITIIGGDPLSEQNYLDFQSKVHMYGNNNMQIGTAYGMTEAAGLISTSGFKKASTKYVSLHELQNGNIIPSKKGAGKFLASGGRSRNGVQVAIVDLKNKILPIGTVGSVVFSSPSLFEGYEGGKDASELQIEISAEGGDIRTGFFETGDDGVILEDEHGLEVFIIGRQKENIPLNQGVAYPIDLETSAARAHSTLIVDQILAINDLTNEFLTQLIVVGIPPFTPESLQCEIIKGINEEILKDFPLACVRTVLISVDTIPSTPTSGKKPRSATAFAFRDGNLKILRETASIYDDKRRKSVGNPQKSVSAWDSHDLENGESWSIETNLKNDSDITTYLSKLGVVEPETSIPLPKKLKDFLQRALLQTQKGYGFSLLKGLPHEFDETTLERFVFELGKFIGNVVPQNVSGDLVTKVTDQSKGNANARGYRSNVPLAFHSDTSDMLALFCVRPAQKGGHSALVSSLKIYETLSRERPDILPILMDGYRYLYPEKTIPTTNRIPVFSIFEGVVSCRVLRAFVERAGPLSLKEKEALDVFQEIAERPEMGVSLMLNTGDFLLVNNFSVLHSRTGFLDADEHDRKRLLLRLWMNGECGQSVDPRLREQSLRFQKI